MGKAIHVISNVDEDMKTADCAFCGRVKVKLKNNGKGRSRRWACTIAQKKWDGARCKTGKPLRNMTDEQMAHYVFNRHGSCDICGSVPRRMLNRDHCHVTGNLRGLLCFRCNTLLGKFDDSIEKLRIKADIFLKAACYLERNDTKF